MADDKYRLLLNIQIAADKLEEAGWEIDYRTYNGTPTIKEFSIFKPENELYDDVLYFVSAEYKTVFPSDRYYYVCNIEIEGKAPHIFIKNKDDFEIVNKMLSVFQFYKDFEVRLDNIVMNGGSLLDLCTAGTELFSNPLYVHDRFFTVLALPKYEEGMLKFEEGQTKGSLHIPLWLINEFKFDPSYQRTLQHLNASIWGKDQYPHNIRSLYVNLFDNNAYFGRLLINELDTPLKSGQFRLAEIFAEYIKLIINRDSISKNTHYNNYENVIKNMLNGEISSAKTDISDFLEIQGWSQDDEYLCIKFQTQDDTLQIQSDEAIRSRLVSEIKDCFDFYSEQHLCLIINITTTQLTPTKIRTYIAEIVRDSYMYCGVSNKIQGFNNIYSGFLQAEIALNHIRKNSHQWIQTFKDCGLDYILSNIESELEKPFLISPYPALLKDYDAAHGSEYYKTLKSYLVNERDIPKTSEDLVIHRTTLTHRLQQMQKIIHPDFENEDERLYLLLSFKLFEKK